MRKHSLMIFSTFQNVYVSGNIRNLKEMFPGYYTILVQIYIILCYAVTYLLILVSGKDQINLDYLVWSHVRFIQSILTLYNKTNKCFTEFYEKHTWIFLSRKTLLSLPPDVARLHMWYVLGQTDSVPLEKVFLLGKSLKSYFPL